MVNSRFGQPMKTARGATVVNITVGSKNYVAGPLGTANSGSASYQVVKYGTDGVSATSGAFNFSSAATTFVANDATATGGSRLLVLIGQSRGVYTITTGAVAGNAARLLVTPVPTVAETSLYFVAGGQDVLFDELRLVKGGSLQGLAGVQYGMFVSAVGGFAKFKMILGANGVNTEVVADDNISASNMEVEAFGY